MDVAIAVAKEADVQQALALSEAALSILPKLNPYAEKFYDTSTSSSSLRKSTEALVALEREYENCLRKLGRVIVTINPHTSSLNPNREEATQEDYRALDSTFVTE